MTVVRAPNTYTLMTTVLVLVLSVLACALPASTTVPTTPSPTVVKAATTVPPKPKPADNTLTTVAVTAYRSLHVRQHPDNTAVVLGYLYSGNPVILTGTCQAGWAQIAWKNSTAWVSAKYLSDNLCMEDGS